MYGYIYMIVNKTNGKKYIGQHKSMKFCHQDKYMGSGKKLASAKKHYGIENFEKLLVQYVETQEEANEQEIFWIAHYDTTNPEKGYNILVGGSQRKDYKPTEETKRKISETMKGRPTWNKGKKTGIVTSTVYKKGHKCYLEGKHHLEETKRKISESCKGGNSTTWRKGCKGLNKGKKYFTNPESKESKLFYPGKEPKGWILGRYTPWQGKENK